MPTKTKVQPRETLYESDGHHASDIRGQTQRPTECQPTGMPRRRKPDNLRQLSLNVFTIERHGSKNVGLFGLSV